MKVHFFPSTLEPRSCCFSHICEFVEKKTAVWLNQDFPVIHVFAISTSTFAFKLDGGDLPKYVIDWIDHTIRIVELSVTVSHLNNIWVCYRSIGDIACQSPELSSSIEANQLPYAKNQEVLHQLHCYATLAAYQISSKQWQPATIDELHLHTKRQCDLFFQFCHTFFFCFVNFLSLWVKGWAV